MSTALLDLTLEIVSRARFDMMDLRERMSPAEREALAPYPRALFWSSHTTAGFLDRSVASRLTSKPGVAEYVATFRALFPEGAPYEHDQMDRRVELPPEQRLVEPKNGDSHLAFIAAGMRTCVSYRNRPAEPVCFVDLDGVSAGGYRRRRTRVVGYNDEERVYEAAVEVPVSSHAVDSVNLKDPRLGLYDQLAELLSKFGIAKGRVRLSLDDSERHAGLTVNEYETLLMRHDLAEVLRDPLRFAIEQGRHVWANPRAVPAKTLEYAKYDLVQVINHLVDGLGLHESIVERLISRALAAPADRFLRMKRSVNLLVSDDDGSGHGRVVEGKYQSPILVQWDRSPSQTRTLNLTLTALS